MELMKILISIAFFAIWLGAIPFMPEFITVQMQNLMTVIFVMILLYWIMKDGISGNWG